MNYYVFDTPQLAVEKIANDMLQYSLQNRPIHISLSGGSTPKRLFTTLAQTPFATEIHWKNLHFWWGDERCVVPEDKESNFGDVKTRLFDHIVIPMENIHRIQGEADPQQECQRYCQEMQQVMGSSPKFDWIILGMGTDGHTASLFPHHTHYEDEHWVIVATHPESQQKRISKSAKLISHASRITYLVTGKNKASILQEIQQIPSRNLSYPAAHIKAKKGITEWYLDIEAASLLD